MAGGFVDELILDSEVILARTILAPVALAGRKGATFPAFTAAEGGKVFLELGGVAIGEGRVVKRGGRHYFKMARLYSKDVEAGV